MSNQLASIASCRFYVKKKSRYCRQMPAPGGYAFCAMHLAHDCDASSVDERKSDSLVPPVLKGLRILCPYCKTSVCEKELQRHVAKCPQKLIEERIVSQPCYSHNVNLFAPGFDSSTSALQLDVSDLPRTSDKHNLDNTWLKMMLAKHLLSRGQFEQLVARINHSFQEVFGAESIGETKVIQEHVLLPLFCEHLFKLGASHKHIAQQVSIIGHMDKHNCLDLQQYTLVEFGAGKGELSHMICVAAKAKSNSDTSGSNNGGGDGGNINGGDGSNNGSNCGDDGSNKNINSDGSNKNINSDGSNKNINSDGSNNFCNKNTPIVSYDKNPHVVLIDRDTFRRKADNWIRMTLFDKLPPLATFAAEQQRLHRMRVQLEPEQIAAVQRIMIDIKDLDWKKMGAWNTKTQHKCLITGKHLCGIATDLTLRCISAKPDIVHAIFVALCCHQICSYESYINPDFFTKLGFSGQDFMIIKLLSSWAICQFHHPISSSSSSVSPSPNEFIYGQLDIDQRAELGYKCKRLIDMGRVHYLRERGYDASLVYYADKSHTPENCMLVAIKKC